LRLKKRPKIDSKRGSRRQLTTLLAAVIVTTSLDGTKRLVHCFLLFFFKVQQTLHKTTFYSGPPSVFNSPAAWKQKINQKYQNYDYESLLPTPLSRARSCCARVPCAHPLMLARLPVQAWAPVPRAHRATT
jgi:hypothetical protein